MPRKRLLEEVIYKPDPNRVHPPIDTTLQKRHNAERARRIGRIKTDDELPFADAAIDEALARMEALARTPADFLVIAMAKGMRRINEGRRRGAREPRELSEKVGARIKTTLLAFSKLSRKLQRHHLGDGTVRQLIEDVRAMGHETNEDRLKKDLAQVHPIIKLVQAGKVSPSFVRLIIDGKAPPPGPSVSKRTVLEQRTGKQAVALAGTRMILLGLIRKRFLGN